MSAPSPTPAGWYTDPHTGAPRWWDGHAWSAPLPAAVGRATVPAGTPVYTVWIWLNTALPVLSMILATWESVLLVDLMKGQMQQVTAFGSDPSALSASPYGLLNPMLSMSTATTLLSVASWVIYALCVLFAVLDHRDLGRLGYSRRFHWAWSFLGAVYPIGRSVVVARQAGRGRAPMWVTIGYLAVSTVGGFVLAFWVMAEIFSAIPGLH